MTRGSCILALRRYEDHQAAIGKPVKPARFQDISGHDLRQACRSLGLMSNPPARRTALSARERRQKAARYAFNRGQRLAKR
jgi:hypothetical protein